MKTNQLLLCLSAEETAEKVAKLQPINKHAETTAILEGFKAGKFDAEDYDVWKLHYDAALHRYTTALGSQLPSEVKAAQTPVAAPKEKA